MWIEELRLNNFRNYRELVLAPHPGVNLFYGRNGSGKTNLLEAIHYCALGRSHRVSNDASVVRNGERFAVSSLRLRNQLGSREIAVHFQPNEAQKKTIRVDQKKTAKFSDLMGCLQCVIFSPEDLGLIKDGPSVRRRYLDMMISQISRGYFLALQQYKTGMEQRNALIRNLRTNSLYDTTLLTAFEETMAEPAARIVRERRKITAQLSVMASDMYHRVSDTAEQFQFSYHTSVKEGEETAETFCRLFRDNREEDLRAGFTSVGPHRDDLTLTLNRNLMRPYASQGQIRTAALSMKLSQMNLLREISGEAPVLLLDDVMSELDRRRRSCLIAEIRSFQTFITCADRHDVELEAIQQAWSVSSADGIASVRPEHSEAIENVSRETMEENAL
mgnify:CR=1 FL=1